MPRRACTEGTPPRNVSILTQTSTLGLKLNLKETFQAKGHP